MTKQIYDLHIRIPLAKVATIVEVLADEGTLLSITQVAEDSQKHYRNSAPRRRNNGPRGIDVVESAVRLCGVNNSVFQSSIEKIFIQENRNPKSVSPLLSQLTTRSILERRGNGEYKVLRLP